MFPAAIFLANRKPNTMSKRPQERRTEEEEPVVAKSKPACLVSRNLSAKQSPSLDSGASYSPGNQELDRNSVFMRTERSVRDSVQNPTASSQEWQRDDNPVSSVGPRLPGRTGVGLEVPLLPVGKGTDV